MTNSQNPADETAKRSLSLCVFVLKRPALAAMVLCSIFPVMLFNLRSASGVNNLPTAERPPASLKSSGFTTPDYSKFSHSNPHEHAELMGRENCGSCHRRKAGSLQPSFPSHKDCTGCHLVQFTASNTSSSVNPICTICHKAEGLNSSSAPNKNFPRLASFTAEFDHAQHMSGIESARPTKGCAACHTPANRGVSETIPAHLTAHQICYECHTPGKQASNLSSCGSCHRLGGYSPTSTAARAYRLGFSHAEHGSRERLTCDQCHNMRGRGLPQARQVASIIPAQHYPNPRTQSCATCHNGQRTFGDKGPNFEVCKRCHKGLKFGT